MLAHEINFDGLVGPTHNYAGLSFGNLASLANRDVVANPRAAALQGLAKMRALAALGIPQAVLPPHERPDVAFLRTKGFSGDDATVLDDARQKKPELLAIAGSASAMWTANAATISPSADCGDGRVHFTVANLSAKPHRALEAAQTERTLRAIFRDESRFAVHPALPASEFGGDEGAANHTRFSSLAPGATDGGVECFAFGEHDADMLALRPARYPARQAYRASTAIARKHGLAPDLVVFAQQNPAAIDAGAFHNDVVAVGHRDLHFFHEDAFLDPHGVTERLAAAFHAATGLSLHSLVVLRAELSLEDAITSYLFNSQIVTRPDGTRLLIAPAECERTPSVKIWLERNIGAGGGPIDAVEFFDLRESMRNGGGPACLRLRVELTAIERAAAAAGVFFTPTLDAQLVAWVKKHYRDQLRRDDLADPALLEETRRALDELTRVLGLGSIYPFQRSGG